VRLLQRGNRDDVDVRSCLANLERLRILDRSGLMDAPPSASLDALTQQAAEALHTPIAAMTLLDDRRQFFASAAGLPVELAQARETPVEQSFCQYVVALDEPVVITDTFQDDLVRDHPATAGGVRAYLGVPVRKDDHCLGSFCVVDVEPRDWSTADISTLEALAKSAMETA
jgi:GAF domain-containing protein